MTQQTHTDGQENRFESPPREAAVVLATFLAVMTTPFLFPAIGEKVITIGVPLAMVVAVSMLYKTPRERLLDGSHWREFMESDLFKSGVELVKRLLLGLVLLMMALFHALTVENALSESEMQEIQSLIVLGPVEVGAFDLMGYSIIIWMFMPFLGYLLERAASAKGVITYINH